MPIVVVDYDPEWKTTFERLRDGILPVLSDFSIQIEHIGSTSVRGLAAKPIIDIDIIATSEAEIAPIIERLATLGYSHQGDLGIPGRDAFAAPADLLKHHLYLCLGDSEALLNHLAVRDYLRANPDTVSAYGELKKRLAIEFADNPVAYWQNKTDFLIAVLEKQGIAPDILRRIEQSNRPA